MNNTQYKIEMLTITEERNSHLPFERERDCELT